MGREEDVERQRERLRYCEHSEAIAMNSRQTGCLSAQKSELGHQLSAERSGSVAPATATRTAGTR